MSGYLNYKNIDFALKRILIFMFAFFAGAVLNFSGFNDISSVSAASEPDAPLYNRVGSNELRGVWIPSIPTSNFSFPSKSGLSVEQMKAEIDDIIKNCKETNLNAIFFQVRPAGDALYDSSIFPTSIYLTGKQGESFVGGFDPLKYIIQAAHANNIELHAWINPYRITANSHDLNALAANNPARKNPQWVVKYADGRMYYNPGLPETRELITNGVIEIIKNYNVDGIHFDDYFYPYPVAGAKFDDDAAFAKYGSGYKTVEDFRRASVNKLVQNVYLEIKKIKPEVRFGISPFGIWANQSAAYPTGSKTNGLSSYSAIYSDAKAWIEGGYIDYICPQIYWSFGTEVARYDVLVRWWSAVVDGTGIDLYIGHAAHKVPDWQNGLELPRQVEYARSYMGVAGSVFYGFKNIVENSYDIKDSLAKLFALPRYISPPLDNGKGITVGRPANNSFVTDSAINIMAGSNPIFPVYYKGEKLTRTKSGFFSVYVPLTDGKNNIYLSQNNTTLTHVITKGKASANNSSDASYAQMDSFKIEIVSPINDIITTPGDKIIVTVQAPSKSTVTAKLGGAVITLKPIKEPPDEGPYMTEVYRETITLPTTQPNGQMLDLGNIDFTALRGNEAATITGINVKLINESAYRPCQVIKDFSNLRIRTEATPGWWEDYLPASVGMRDNVVAFKDGYYKLGFGGYISSKNVVLMPEKTLLVNRILSAAMEDVGKITEIRFGVTENVPVDAKCKDGVFTITLFNTPDGARSLSIASNPIFKAVKSSSNKEKKTATYTFDLINADNYYGFEVVYEGGFIIFKVKNPIKKIEGNLPLKGLTIAIDPGHGGNDTGALGFLGTKGKMEKDLNLEIALAVKPKLIALGANVVLTRDKDERVELYDRVDIFNAVKADLAISIHHNSLVDSSDNALTRGLLPLYCDEAGRLLAKTVGKATAAELNRIERATRYQTLGVMRGHKMPVALLEMSFITNPDEYEFAHSSEAVQRSAEGIAKGIADWIDAQQAYVK